MTPLAVRRTKFRRGAIERSFENHRPLEAEVSASIRRELSRLGWFVSSTQQSRPSGQTVGMPDLFAAHPAQRRFAWVEVKRPGESPRLSQQAWHRMVRDSGCPVIVADSAYSAITQLMALPKSPNVAPHSSDEVGTAQSSVEEP